MTVYAVNYDNGFGITEDLSRVLFMVAEKSNISCKGFVDKNQAYVHACTIYAENHARFEFPRSLPMPMLEAFSMNDMFNAPLGPPFLIHFEQRWFSVAIYENNICMGMALFNGIGQLANFCKSHIISNFQEFPNEFLAKEWIWRQQMIPLIAMSAYISDPIYMPMPGVGEFVPGIQPSVAPLAKASFSDIPLNSSGLNFGNIGGGRHENF